MPVNSALERLEAAQALLAMANALPVRVLFHELHEAFPVNHRTPADMAEMLREIDWGKP